MFTLRDGSPVGRLIFGGLLLLATLVFWVGSARRPVLSGVNTRTLTSATDSNARRRLFPPAFVGGPYIEPHDLALDESRGGFTLARYIGRSDQDLRDRLQREPELAAASTYSDRRAAERTVARALAERPTLVGAWVKGTESQPTLTIVYRGRDMVGRLLRRGDREPEPATDAIVVLEKTANGAYFVRMSYPESHR